MANGVMLAGHVEIEDYANIGGMTPLHQFVRVGCHAMVGGLSRVTNDIPLAGRCLKEGAFAIKPNGDTYTNDNIGMALASREIMEGIRETGEMTGGPPPFSKADRSKFLNRMEMIVQQARKS